MAMIGRGAAIAEVGPHRHELHGAIAFSAWLGVHASLMTGVRNRVDAFIAWGWDSFSSGTRAAGAQPHRGRADRLGGGRRPRPPTCAVIQFALTQVDLARIQFAFTSLYHFLFVPLTLGLAPLVAVMHTLWHRSGDERWLRLTRFFGTLLLINFAIGVATGLVQEFQFGMNWAVYSAFVGNVFGAPLAIEGLAAFSLEAVFLGLWVFGWDRLPRRVHLATIWLAALGMCLSAYFILVANSWMQYPVGYQLADNGTKAELTDVWQLLGSKFAIHAWLHTMLASLTVAGVVVSRRDVLALRTRSQRRGVPQGGVLALIVLVPVSILNLAVGSRFGIITTDVQPMKIAAAEALWDTQDPASFSLFQVGGFSSEHPDPSFQIAVPGLLSFLATGSFKEPVQGLNQIQAQYEQRYGPGNYVPPVRPAYWAMRVMAYGGVARGARRAGRRMAVPPPQARDDPLVPVGRGGGDRAAVHRGAGGLGAHRGRPPAVDRPGPAAHRRRRVADREHGDDRHQPRRVRAALRGARGRRLRAHAPLRDNRPAGRGRARLSHGPRDPLVRSHRRDVERVPGA